MESNQYDSSFRDINNGFIFQENGIFYRQVSKSYQGNYELLINSGLYNHLTERAYLIKHEEVDCFLDRKDCYKILKPYQISFISYPASWSFSMLKDAALLTLNIQKQALLHGMILKDASSYNVQYLDGKAIFIDTLSFEQLKDGNSWLAFGQFCRHFLAPLALLSYSDINLHKLFTLYLDGIPLNLTVKLLPLKSRFNLGLYLHLFLHNRLIQNNKFQESKIVKAHLSFKDLLNQTESLIDTIKNLEPPKEITEWENYYKEDVLEDYINHKKVIVEDLINLIKPSALLDLGSNDGTFSIVAAMKVEKVLAFDIDPMAVEKLYKRIKKDKITNIIPLIIDITNPEPSIGWANEEREGIWKRIDVDTIMVLALIHHLRITGGIPLWKIAKKLSEHCKNLIIEFIPKSDSKVKFLLRNREDTFNDYNQETFTQIFNEYFDIVSKEIIPTTNRILFLMNKK